MKRYFYIVAFMLLGYLISFLVHAGIEILILSVIMGNYEVYGDSFFWWNWTLFHRVGGILLSLGGLSLGWFLGRKFWQILYVEQRYGAPWW